jgi:hypothetical protein
MLLGFGGPAADAAKAVGMKFTPEGSLTSTEPKAEAAPTEPESAPAPKEPEDAETNP